MNPERGRKPNTFWITFADAPALFQNVNPERGRKLNEAKRRNAKRLYCISEREPRKGTETPCEYLNNLIGGLKFQNVNPERGRKLPKQDESPENKDDFRT